MATSFLYSLTSRACRGKASFQGLAARRALDHPKVMWAPFGLQYHTPERAIIICAKERAVTCLRKYVMPLPGTHGPPRPDATAGGPCP